MAQQIEGRRAVVQDPLRQQASAPLDSGQLPVGLVRGPDRPNLSGMNAETERLNRAMAGLSAFADSKFEEAMDEAITDGKVAYMSGVTEQELLKTGNRYTQMGYLQLQARNDVNNWYLNEQADLQDKSRSMAPADYQKYLSEKRKSYLDGVKDPYARKVAVAAFEQLNPDLAAKQFTQNNDYNYDQRKQGFREYIRTGVIASPTTGTVIPGETSLTVQPQAVEPVIQSSVMDRDAGIKTMVGEASNQGETGLAAVAHSFRNRMLDSRFPSSIGGVVRQKGQYSTWDLDASYLATLKPGNPVYDKAAKIYDVVMSGRHIDPTGGALNYHSPKGMEAYARRGIKVSQATLQRTRAAEADPNSIRIGGHVFYNPGNKARAVVTAMVDPETDLVVPEEQGDTSGNETKYVDEGLKKGKTSVNEFPGMTRVTEGTESAAVTADLNETAKAEGVSGIKETGAPNELMDMMANDKSLKAEDKIEILAEEISSELLAGGNTILENVGGIAGLKRFGIKSTDLDKIVRANERYQTEQDKKFNKDRLLFQDKVYRMADQEGAQVEPLLDLIGEEVKANRMSDQAGSSLASSAMAQIRTNEGKAKTDGEQDARYERWANPEFRTEVGQLYQQLATDEGVPLDIARRKVDELAERYGMDKQDVANIMGQMATIDQQRLTNIRTETEKRVKATQQSEANKQQVSEALSKGQGLAGLRDVQIKTVNQDGTTSTMNGEEYGIEVIRKEAQMQHPDDAAAQAAYFFPKLQQQDVIDKTTQRELVAAMSGNIMVKNADGKLALTEEAKNAYNLYAQLRKNGTINPSFIKRQVGDDYTGAILEQAYSFDGGSLNGPEALIRAKDMFDNKEIDPAYQSRTDRELDKALDGQGAEFVKTKMAGSWGDWFKTPGNVVDQAVAYDSSSMNNALRTRALRYRDLFPHMTPDAVIDKAKQDLDHDTYRIAGNVILSSTPITFVDGPTRPVDIDNAMTAYLTQNQTKLFGGTDTNVPTLGTTSLGSAPMPAVKLMWVEGLQQFFAWPITNVQTGDIDMGKRRVIDPSEVGEWYREHNRQESVFNKFGKLFDNNIVQDWKSGTSSVSGSAVTNAWDAVQR